MLHNPEPDNGNVAFKVAVLPHNVWSVPGSEIEGGASKVMLTDEAIIGQVPLELLHSKTYD